MRIHNWLTPLLEYSRYFWRPCLILWVEWIKAWSNTSMNPQWIYVYMDFVHLRNPINVRQNELLTICLYWEGNEDRFVVVQQFWCRKICQIVCRVSRKWMESKYFDHDVDVESLTNKGIVIRCFVRFVINTII